MNKQTIAFIALTSLVVVCVTILCALGKLPVAVAAGIFGAAIPSGPMATRYL